MLRYLGRTTATSQPSFKSARGRAPTTSAKPPVLAKGTTSEAAKRIFKERRGRASSRDFLGVVLVFLTALRGIEVLDNSNVTNQGRHYRGRVKAVKERGKKSPAKIVLFGKFRLRAGSSVFLNYQRLFFVVSSSFLPANPGGLFGFSCGISTSRRNRSRLSPPPKNRLQPPGISVGRSRLRPLRICSSHFPLFGPSIRKFAKSHPGLSGMRIIPRPS